MLKIILTKGGVAVGKSSWAKAEVAKDPNNTIRINNDDIRGMLNNSVFSPEMENLVTATREFFN